MKSATQKNSRLCRRGVRARIFCRLLQSVKRCLRLGATAARLRKSCISAISPGTTIANNKELNPEPTQLLYDSITNHGVNDTVSRDAAAAAIRNIVIDSPLPPASSGN